MDSEHADLFGYRPAEYVTNRTRTRRFIRGLKRLYGSSRRLRRPLMASHLRAAVESGLFTGSHELRSAKAAILLGWRHLLRGSEVAIPNGVAFDVTKHLTRGDFTIDESRKRAFLRLRPSKTDPFFNIDGPQLVLSFNRDDPICPGVALHDMITKDTLPSSSSTPLFRIGKAPLRYRDLLAHIRIMMTRLGHRPSDYGTHSMRIGGATALHAAGAGAADIMAYGRWRSDCYLRYLASTPGRFLHFSKIMAQVDDTDVLEASNLARRVVPAQPSLVEPPPGDSFEDTDADTDGDSDTD
jgi:hypothetical protein